MTLTRAQLPNGTVAVEAPPGNEKELIRKILSAGIFFAIEPMPYGFHRVYVKEEDAGKLVEWVWRVR